MQENVLIVVFITTRYTQPVPTQPGLAEKTERKTYTRPIYTDNREEERRARKFKNNEQHMEGKRHRTQNPAQKNKMHRQLNNKKESNRKTLGCLTVGFYFLDKKKKRGLP